MTQLASPPGWYPDPAHRHEWRYFDGAAWSDSVSDGGVVTDAPLGPVPPGLTAWFPPQVMTRTMYATRPAEEPPRVRMWVFAVLSFATISVRTPDTHLVFPIGIAAAIWCWGITAPVLRARRAAGASTTEIQAARWVAATLAGVTTLISVLVLASN